MNVKRLFFAIIIVFAVVWIADALVHAVWLKADYAATMSLWRPEAEMRAHFGWLMMGQAVYALMFTALYALGFASRNSLRVALVYGLFMGLFFGANSVAAYAIMPLPGELPAKWFLAEAVRGLLLGAVIYFCLRSKQVVANKN